jgi:hypothetical protein
MEVIQPKVQTAIRFRFQILRTSRNDAEKLGKHVHKQIHGFVARLIDLVGLPPFPGYDK